MRKLILLITCFLAAYSSFAQVTDAQVVEHAKQSASQGKSQTQIVSELQGMGVTVEQAQRIKAAYESGQYGDGSSGSNQQSSVGDDVSRELGSETESDAELSDEVISGAGGGGRGSSNAIFGHNIFRTRNLSFAPNVNMATPENYRLGPGDEVIINIWGASQASIRQTIRPEGNIVVDKLGPVYLSGMSIDAANKYLQKEFGRIYSVAGETPNSQINLSLGQIRTIQVNIMGEVAQPGTYVLSAFATVFHALYQAGGVNNRGTLRDIKVFRKEKEIASLDIYEFILEGKMSIDFRLEDNDLILVEPYKNLVKISGNVKRPMRYEMVENETIETLIKYAGGFMGDAHRDKLNLVRNTEREREIFTIAQEVYSSFKLNDGDALLINSNLDMFKNIVTIEGCVFRGGDYQLGGDVNTVKQLIEKAEGLTGDAFLNRAILHRTKPDLTFEIIPIDLTKLFNGAIEDIPLQNLDVLYISSIYDMQDRGAFTISGQVSRPGTYTFKENTTLSDLIVQAGGFLESASTVRIEVARRLKDPLSLTETDTIGQTFTFAVRDDFFIEGDSNFMLEPYDYVFVRRSPGYFPQQSVTINGEVLFPGSYVLTRKNQRVSELVNMAGGTLKSAYTEGAYLLRIMTDDEYEKRNTIRDMVVKQSRGGDSLDIAKFSFSRNYYVAIELDQALANPGSDYDFVLQPGDRLFIPQYISTVRIQGSVMHPNVVLYNSDLRVKDYVNLSGGYAHRAKKNKAYVIYMNGMVAKIKKNQKNVIHPGSEIVIPSKPKKNSANLTEILAIATTSSSIASMLATITNLVK